MTEELAVLAAPESVYTINNGAMMTPYELEIILHYCISGKNFPRDAALAFRETADKLCASGLLEYNDILSFYRVTEKGRAWLEFALKTPLPVQKWVLPEAG